MKKKPISKNSGRRAKALFWLTSVAVIIGILLYFEQVAVIYVLSTLGLIILLAVVALADLENVGREEQTFSESNAEKDQTEPETQKTTQIQEEKG